MLSRHERSGSDRYGWPERYVMRLTMHTLTYGPSAQEQNHQILGLYLSKAELHLLH